MRMLVVPQRHPGTPGDNRTHFLLKGASVRAIVGFADGSFAKPIDGVAAAEPGSFAVELTPGLAAPGVAATQMDITYTVALTLGGATFTALTVAQRIMMVATPAVPLGYTLMPGGWFDAKGSLRTANLRVHPLVQAAKLGEGRIEVNTLILDITTGWNWLHGLAVEQEVPAEVAGQVNELHTQNKKQIQKPEKEQNLYYKIYKELRQAEDPEMRILAHTGGTPLIWYALIPPHLVGAREVSPHIFLQPSDNREGQDPYNDEKYLLKNDAYFQTDGLDLMRYVVAPATDLQVQRLKSLIPSITDWRNVVGVIRARAPTSKKRLSPTQWDIPMGLSRAFIHRGNAQPAQFLLLPQRRGKKDSQYSDDYGVAVNAFVLRTTRAILALVETNTSLTLHGGDTLLDLGKLVYSGYSEAGVELWQVAKTLGPHLKAMIAVEPTDLNEIQNDRRKKNADGILAGPEPVIGKDVIPGLLKSGVTVYIIGRHHAANYHPDIQGKLPELMPANPAKVFAYPPNPAVNNFVKYRVNRFVDPASDPLMLAREKAIMKELEDKGLTGLATFPKVFPEESNKDKPDDRDIHQWYSHQFAMSGGDELTPDPSGLYGTPVTYRTWFQVATQKIG